MRSSTWRSWAPNGGPPLQAGSAGRDEATGSGPQTSGSNSATTQQQPNRTHGATSLPSLRPSRASGASGRDRPEFGPGPPGFPFRTSVIRRLRRPLGGALLRQRDQAGRLQTGSRPQATGFRRSQVRRFMQERSQGSATVGSTRRQAAPASLRQL